MAAPVTCGMRYSPYVLPVLQDAVRCVAFALSSIDIETSAYRFMLDFAKDHEPIVIDPPTPASSDYCPVSGNALGKIRFQVPQKKTANLNAPVTGARLAVCRRRATCVAL